jgi:osmotically-inducible protein OsmY
MKSNFPAALFLSGLAIFGGMSAACRSTQSAGTQLDDTAITARVKTKYVAESDLNPFNISVETSEGVVYLMGRVQRGSQRQRAEQIAADTEGVKEVVNHIEVGEKSD